MILTYAFWYGGVMPAVRLLPTEDAQDLIDLTREICAKDLAPQVDEMERAAEFPRETFRLLGKSGLLSLPYPEEYGGGGQPYEVYLQVVEEIASVWMSVGGRRQRPRADLLPGRRRAPRSSAGVAARHARRRPARRLLPVRAEAGSDRPRCHPGASATATHTDQRDQGLDHPRRPGRLLHVFARTATTEAGSPASSCRRTPRGSSATRRSARWA